MIKISAAIFFLLVVCAFAQEEWERSFEQLSVEEQRQEIMKLMKQQSVGPCHGAVSINKCCQWIEDSTAVKRVEKSNDRLETLRHCCYSMKCETIQEKSRK